MFSDVQVGCGTYDGAEAMEKECELDLEDPNDKLECSYEISADQPNVLEPFSFTASSEYALKGNPATK